jgi:aspartyl-tRNA(Asn)/glutamyl-tRNA(Gln) amidotransferase subunit C
MVEVNETLTRRVANLSRLELTDTEVKLFTTQIGEILKYVDGLQKVDVTGVEPLFHPLEVSTPLREDIAKPFPTDADGQSKVLSSAPDVVDGGFKVPQIL